MPAGRTIAQDSPGAVGENLKISQYRHQEKPYGEKNWSYQWFRT